MASSAQTTDSAVFRVLAITQGLWGERIADNITRNCPEGWVINRWAAPRALPPPAGAREEEQDRRVPSPVVIVDKGQRDHGDQADQNGSELAHQEERIVAEAAVADHQACAVDHAGAEDEQQCDRCQQNEI